VATHQEYFVNLIDHLPPGEHDSFGEFHASRARLPGPVVLSPQSSYRLVTSLDSLRGRAALVSRRLAGVQDWVEVVEHPDAIAPRLCNSDGELISDDWRYLARAILSATASGAKLLPTTVADQIEAAVNLIQRDLIVTLEKAIFAGVDQFARVAARVVSARLAWFDRLLAKQRYVLGEVLTEADVWLFSMLIGFDLEYRAHLGARTQPLVEYADLWGYARGLLQLPGFADDAELIAVGIFPDAQGRFAGAWGAPLPITGVADLRVAWLDGDGRQRDCAGGMSAG
jgi:glutathionyl-hydroquinone reductase